jgi:hypothetical protein
MAVIAQNIMVKTKEVDKQSCSHDKHTMGL